jgi:hypothetical protein
VVLGPSGEAGIVGMGVLAGIAESAWPLAARGGVRALVASRRGTRAVSSAGERFPDTEEVTGSNPVRPTPFFENPSSGESPNESQRPGVLPNSGWSEHSCGGLAAADGLRSASADRAPDPGNADIRYYR